MSREFDFNKDFEDITLHEQVKEVLRQVEEQGIGGIQKARPRIGQGNSNIKYAGLGNPPMNLDLPASRGVVTGSGRCGTAHLAMFYTLLFSQYVWTTHEFPPAFAFESHNIYKHRAWATASARELGEQKLSSLNSRYEQRDGGLVIPIRRWLDVSAWSSPYIYSMLRIDPDLKVAVMIRNPVDFYRSCIKLEQKPGAFFIRSWDWGFYFDEETKQKEGKERWYYDRYWYDCYKLLFDQFKEAHRVPDYVWELGKYSRGEYADQLLEWWDIPLTRTNIERAKWYCSERGNRLHRTEERKPIEVPDLSYCNELWEFWKNLS